MQFAFDDLSSGEALILVAMCDDYLDRLLPPNRGDSLSSGLCMYFKDWLIAEGYESTSGRAYHLIQNIRDAHLPEWQGGTFVVKRSGVGPVRDRFVKEVRELAWGRV